MNDYIQPDLFDQLPARTARSVAIELIINYVRRGDTLKSLKDGQGGHYGGGDGASIGGHCNGKKYSSDNIIVSKLNGKEIYEVFKLKEIYDYIKENL